MKYDDRGGACDQQAGAMSVLSEPALISWSQLKKATSEDAVMVKLIEEIQRGIPDSSHDVHKDIRLFHKYRHGLMVVDGVVC